MSDIELARRVELIRRRSWRALEHVTNSDDACDLRDLFAYIDALAARAKALEVALRRIVDEGDPTAPEGMKRIARDALASAQPEAAQGRVLTIRAPNGSAVRYDLGADRYSREPEAAQGEGAKLLFSAPLGVPVPEGGEHA